MSRRQSFQAVLCLLVVGGLLCLSLIVAKWAHQMGLPQLSFLMLAMGVAGVLLLIGGRMMGHTWVWRADVWRYAVFSGGLMAFPNALGFVAVGHVGAGYLAMNMAFPPLMTWGIAVLLGMEKMRPVRLIGVLTGLSGALILAWGKQQTLGADAIWAIWVLFMPLTLAVGNIYRTRAWPKQVSVMQLSGSMLVAAALWLIPPALIWESSTLQTVFLPEAWGLLLLEVLVFVVMYVLFFVLQRLAGPVYLSQIGSVAALSGSLVAVFGLGEVAPDHFAVAALLVLLGVVIFQQSAQSSSVKKPIERGSEV
ncbi:hypothetical protein BFW38_09575 [Terasakiispira papahanaumokuakeensis]|uniref:EamA domain-containing protein n=1 Tax=Terasakiispira papahanaumokuakeensis TaxID=197479 RepID=A0A1E2VA68_9GAMM|nr:DMT family transporter [Terasakiispira papahanaumokuakeensis]ODC03752.1 hypothetical protein BFW38_09575 [Terasakiispira papahanaumokuakeensis]